MKKILSAVLAVAFLFSVASIASAQLEGIEITGDANVYLIDSAGWNKEGTGPDARNGDQYDTTQAMVNLFVTKTFSNDGKLVIHLRGGASSDGDNINFSDAGGYSGAINDAAVEYGITDNFWLHEFYYTQAVVEDLAVITFGKTGEVGVGNDVAAGFSGFFASGNASAIGPSTRGKNPYTVKVDVTPIDLITVTYGYSAGTTLANPKDNTTDRDSFLSNGFNGIVVNFKPIEKGNYRIGYWSNNHEGQVYKKDDDSLNGFIPDANEKSGSSGIAISIDQEVIEGVGLFARFGQRLDSTRGFDDNKLLYTQWQFGGKLSGNFWSRENDFVFVAVGQAIGSDAIQGRDIGDDGKFVDLKAETHIELYYNYAVTENLSVAPIFEYITNLEGYENQSAAAVSLRASITF